MTRLGFVSTYWTWFHSYFRSTTTDRERKLLIPENCETTSKVKEVQHETIYFNVSRRPDFHEILHLEVLFPTAYPVPGRFYEQEGARDRLHAAAATGTHRPDRVCYEHTDEKGGNEADVGGSGWYHPFPAALRPSGIGRRLQIAYVLLRATVPPFPTQFSPLHVSLAASLSLRE